MVLGCCTVLAWHNFSNSRCSTPLEHITASSNRSVFVGADKVTGEIVALKRINTEAEENGFPITAIREVKILKALKHDNIVHLKEIVTSKGESQHKCYYIGVLVFGGKIQSMADQSLRVLPSFTFLLDVHSSTRPN